MFEYYEKIDFYGHDDCKGIGFFFFFLLKSSLEA
jgi:hypothetical protein